MNKKLISALLFVAMLQCPSMADNWAHWRGPTGNGVAPNAQPPVQWSSTRNVKWKVAIPGRGSGSPVIWEERVFVVTAVPVGSDAGRQAGSPDSAARPQSQGDPRLRQFPGRRGGGVRTVDEAGIQGSLFRSQHRPAALGPNGHRGDTSSGNTRHEHVRIRIALHRWKTRLRSLRFSRTLLLHDGRRTEMETRRLRARWILAAVSAKEVRRHSKATRFWCLGITKGRRICTHSTNRPARPIWKTERDEPTCWATPLVVEHRRGETGRHERANLCTSVRSGNGKRTLAMRRPDPASGCVGRCCGTVWCLSEAVFRDRFWVPFAWTARVTSKTQSMSSGCWIAIPRISRRHCYRADASTFTRARPGCCRVLTRRLENPITRQLEFPASTSTYASPIAAGGHVYLTGRSGTTVVIKDSDQLEIVASNSVGETVDATPAPVDNELFIRGENSSVLHFRVVPGESWLTWYWSAEADGHRRRPAQPRGAPLQHVVGKRLAHLAGKVLIGLCIANVLFFGGVPVEFPAESDGGYP